VEFAGIVQRRRLSAGSKSEHEGLVLVTSSAEYALRRQGGNPFWDEELAPLEGKRIQCDGLVRGNQLIMTRWKVIEG
jgi:hypothetical protein